MTNNTISLDQIEALTLPLNRATSILWLTLDSIEGAHQSEAVYAARDLVKEGIKIACSLSENPPKEEGKAKANPVAPAPSSEKPTTSLDVEVDLRFGPDATHAQIFDFTSKRLTQLNASLLTLQSDLHLENNGGDSLSVNGRLDAIWGMLDCVEQIKSGLFEYDRVLTKEAAS